MPRCAICDTELSPYQAAEDDLCGTCHQEVDRVFYDPDILDNLPERAIEHSGQPACNDPRTCYTNRAEHEKETR